MGDGLMAVFSSAVDAVECAVAIQRTVNATPADTAVAVAVRVGLNAGEVTEEGGAQRSTF